MYLAYAYKKNNNISKIYYHGQRLNNHYWYITLALMSDTFTKVHNYLYLTVVITCYGNNKNTISATYCWPSWKYIQMYGLKL